jgi:DNA gyrase/topoisomerase IV subunit A
MDRHEDDFLEHVFVASTTGHARLLHGAGPGARARRGDMPEAGPSSRGRALAQLLTLERGRPRRRTRAGRGVHGGPLPAVPHGGGTVKRTTLDQYANIRSGGIAAIRVQDGDRLLDVQVSEGTNDVVLVTRQGRAIRFPENEVPLMGRVSQGVKGSACARATRGRHGRGPARGDAVHRDGERLCEAHARRGVPGAEARRPRHDHARRERRRPGLSSPPRNCSTATS